MKKWNLRRCSWLRFVLVDLYSDVTKAFLSCRSAPYIRHPGKAAQHPHPLLVDGRELTKKGSKIYFMSFCRIFSTLCRQVVFHIVPHFGKRAGQKVQRKIAAAVQKAKSPLLFVPLFWNQRNKLSTIILVVLVIKLTRKRDGGFKREGLEMER